MPVNERVAGEPEPTRSRALTSRSTRHQRRLPLVPWCPSGWSGACPSAWSQAVPPASSHPTSVRSTRPPRSLHINRAVMIRMMLCNRLFRTYGPTSHPPTNAPSVSVRGGPLHTARANAPNPADVAGERNAQNRCKRCFCWLSRTSATQLQTPPYVGLQQITEPDVQVRIRITAARCIRLRADDRPRHRR